VAVNVCYRMMMRAAVILAIPRLPTLLPRKLVRPRKRNWPMMPCAPVDPTHRAANASKPRFRMISPRVNGCTFPNKMAVESIVAMVVTKMVYVVPRHAIPRTEVTLSLAEPTTPTVHRRRPHPHHPAIVPRLDRVRNVWKFRSVAIGYSQSAAQQHVNILDRHMDGVIIREIRSVMKIERSIKFAKLPMRMRQSRRIAPSKVVILRMVEEDVKDALQPQVKDPAGGFMIPRLVQIFVTSRRVALNYGLVILRNQRALLPGLLALLLPSGRGVPSLQRL
jgi:hypothetical protein